MTVTEAEKRLAQYRTRKEREARLNNYKAQLKSMLSKLIPKKEEKPENTNIDIDKPLLSERSSNEVASLSDSNSEIDSRIELLNVDEKSFTVYDYVYYALWGILWVNVYVIFIKLQFGTIYFIVSLLVCMYLNTRTGPKKKNEVSAYSVFNKNCESIEGSLNAEQLTKEMFYGGFR